jgi:carbamoyltransferase
LFERQLAHAAAAFYPSPFEKAAILVVNGFNSPISASFGRGNGNFINTHSQIKFPDSIGFLYSTFTEYCGFEPGSDEYKLMGLAPYGEPAYADIILKRLAHLKSNGAVTLNRGYFNLYQAGKIANKKFNDLFGGPPRNKRDRISKKYMDMACSIQHFTNKVMLSMAVRLYKETGLKNLCMSGDVALNCVANSYIMREGPFKDVWIQPAASDAGCAIGSALLGWHKDMGKPRKVRNGSDSQNASLPGPDYSDAEIEKYLNKNSIKYEKLGRELLLKKVARLLNDKAIIGWFQGRMEFGPRALGNRSILADPRSKDMRDTINSKVKFREPFRPFAPSVLLERAKEYFDINCESPYMLFVSSIKKSGFPAITHVDNSARVQTVKRADNPLFHDLIKQFDKDYGCPMIINTSFNRMGEPIVCTPEDAYRCFKATGIDYLVMGSFLCEKKT